MFSHAERIARGDDIRMGLLARFIAEDSAQDLVEYALLAAFIGIAGWAVLMTLPNVMGATYGSWIDPTVGVPSRWDPPEPASAGS
jgi:Flp pilus assembly pilin Flp